MVRFFNFYYFLYVFLAAVGFVGLYFLGRNKSEVFRRRYVCALCWAMFSIHFLKQLAPSYRARFPYSLTGSTFENICAVSVIIFPIIYLIDNKTLKDYMYYFGVFGGIGAMLFPTEAIGNAAFSFHVVRFYITHFLIFAAPVLMVAYGIHTLDYRRIWRVPCVFLGVLCLILLNEVILIAVGLVPFDLEKFFSPDYRNASLIFGYPSALKPYLGFIDIFVPPFMKHGLLGDASVLVGYWPVLWMVVPVFIYVPIAAFLVSLPFTHKAVKLNYIAFRLKRRQGEMRAQFERSEKYSSKE